MRKGGCWIFLSHSSKDIYKVREIRNEFEKRGHNPLAFHLLCLSNETEEKKKELDGLIKREIDAREWFVYCDSEAAELSPNVKMERDYISEKNKEMKWILDLSKPMDKLIKEIDRICLDLKVFISYAREDRKIVDMLSEELLKYDLDVWQTGDAIEDVFEFTASAIKYNFCIVLITEDYTKSDWCKWELYEMIKSGKHFLPIVVGNAEIPELIKATQVRYMPSEPREEDMRSVVEFIRERIKMELQGSGF